mgnify:CR=1 FL=1
MRVSALVILCSILVLSAGRAEDGLLRYEISDNAIPRSLTGVPGDPARGRAIVVKREATCLLCHSGPFPEQRFQGDLSPDLTGVGSRWSEGELRLRLVDASRLNADTIMPSYYRIDHLVRVARSLRGKPVLTAEEVEVLERGELPVQGVELGSGGGDDRAREAHVFAAGTGTHFRRDSPEGRSDGWDHRRAVKEDDHERVWIFRALFDGGGYVPAGIPDRPIVPGGCDSGVGASGQIIVFRHI